VSAVSTGGPFVRRLIDTDLIDLDIRFTAIDGTCIADVNGMLFCFGGGEYLDPTLVYPEEYWAEYPLYLPDTETGIVVDVTYNGPGQLNLTVVTETYVVNLDGSPGELIDGPNTTDLVAVAGEIEYIPVWFMLPPDVKSLDRVIVRLYSEANLLMTEEALFCPPDEEIVDGMLE
jgi:hypothetical protein